VNPFLNQISRAPSSPGNMGCKMQFIEIIERKRDGFALTEAEIQWMIQHYTSGAIPDYQMSALLMAIYFQGMQKQELMALTEAMIASGKIFDLAPVPGFKIDKHSTGGVGDKVSLILAPLVASAGGCVPMMAGRGLGHTGGTLDKLESIPGYKTELSVEAVIDQLKQVGCAIIGQTEQVAPADRKLYALRDVTATVPSIPLICSSILSKKKAEGTEGLLLDVKIGEGAFLPRRELTMELARTLVNTGNALGINTQALITQMDQPLGQAIGNWLEVLEVIQALQGEGPDDLMEVTLALGSVMLVMAGQEKTCTESRRRLQKQIDSGRAWEHFIRMVELQHGDTAVLLHPDRYPQPRFSENIFAGESGIVQNIKARELGYTAMMLGAGRAKKEERIDPKAGIYLRIKAGDVVQRGDLMVTIHTDNERILDQAIKRIDQAIVIQKETPDLPPLIEAHITPSGEQPWPNNIL
jgi:pyrimidine-nucleoside phosphorylase